MLADRVRNVVRDNETMYMVVDEADAIKWAKERDACFVDFASANVAAAKLKGLKLLYVVPRGDISLSHKLMQPVEF